MERNGRTYTFHRDIQGNITSLTDESGKVVETYTYDPFGSVTIHDSKGNKLVKSKVGNPYFFTGRRLDPETGFYYYRFRMYDPVTGRFLQYDPLGFHDGANLYQYAAGDPVNLIDPMGLSWDETLELWTIGLVKEVGKSFWDGRAHDSLQGFKDGALGRNSKPTYGHKEAYKGGKKIGKVTMEIEKAVIISYAGGQVGSLIKGANIFQNCSKGARILRYTVFKLVDAGIDTATEYIMDENGRCWTAREFAAKFGWNMLYSVLGDAAAATYAKLTGDPRPLTEIAEDFATGIPPCFTAGTLVATEDVLKPIEEIKVGDHVWALDPEKGEARLAEVSAAYERKADRLYIIELEGETIETTREHPFWVRGKGWIEAGNLVEGDKVTTREKGELVIQRITVKTGEYKVYNLKVKDIHTYFVSDSKVLVHNACKQDKPLSKGEIKKLKNAGYDIHELKGGKGASRYDIYKDKKGDLYVKRKGGKGEGEPLNININEL
jgi:RHS repeat-associated protein